MRIDLNCPAEIIRTALSREEDPRAELTLMNLTDRGIDSCEATVRVLDREGTELGRAVHRARALRGRPHSAFVMGVPMELPEEAVSAEAVLDKVWFEDNDVWRRDPAREREYEPNLLPPGNDLNALRYVAGRDALGFPVQQAELWLCVCGRPNGNRDSACVRCRRPRDLVFQQFNRNAVLRQVNQRERQLDLQTRSAREENIQLQRQREEEYNRLQARKSRRRRLAAALICAIALAAVGGFLIEPALRLWSADTALREERLEDAREILTELGAFPGAEDRLTETELRIARRDGRIAAEDPAAFPTERMKEIAGSLRSRGESGDADLADRVLLSAARGLLETGDAPAAEAMLTGLPETLEGREELRLDCAFARGQASLAAGEYETAERIFTELGDYPGAAEKAKEAVYLPALGWMEAGDYDAAIEAFTRLDGYQDSRELIPKCWYLKGFVLENAGEAEEARQAYLKAGNYEDAGERAMRIRWNQAEDLLAGEDYAAALPLYREMDGYQDAREKWLQCAVALAKAAYRQREYLQAVSWLEDLPEDTREIKQIRTRGTYLGAKAAANRGSLEEAIALMEQVSTYSDASRNLRTWRLELARQWMEEERYAEARELLIPIEDYYQAKRLLQELEAELPPAETEDPAENRTEEGTEGP